jgi:hypothetical protein
MNSPNRARLFAALVIVALLTIVAAILFVIRQRTLETPAPAASTAITSAAGTAPVQTPPKTTVLSLPTGTEAAGPVAPTRPAKIFFRNTTLDANYGKLAFREGQHGALQFAGQLSCEVAYASHTVGICLVARRGVVTHYLGQLFDARTFAVRSEFPLQGTPSRNRVSTDGRLAAYTVFLTGHGYSSLDFSTQTVILDAQTGKPITDLEHDFTVTRDGATVKAQDFNFWGVTFADTSTFYATLSTGGKHYLVRGNLAARTMTMIHENVECPSVSPDGRRIAYKKRLNEGGRVLWQLQVLDLASNEETALAERRSIDDQLEWLDNSHVLYSVPSDSQDMGGGTDVWVADAQGRGKPRLFIASAYSPAVVRP